MASGRHPTAFYNRNKKKNPTIRPIRQRRMVIAPFAQRSSATKRANMCAADLADVKFERFTHPRELDSQELPVQVSPSSPRVRESGAYFGKAGKR